MRSLYFLFALLLTAGLPAQNYLQNVAPVQQTIVGDDCYTHNLDNGNAALGRGELKVALRYFNEAKKCPDVQGNSRRTSELDVKIARCEQRLGVVKAESELILPSTASKSSRKNLGTELPSTRKNYRADRQFLRDTLDDCFGRMVEEADRAFQMRFWEDAAALYRAAKNCADADQNDRQRMSEKITLCRNKAEDELFAKQQEAERQARHAIAANLADDAQELLHHVDRTLAFRLADFANQYIAPDDNIDCVQAMFDAWYYHEPETGKQELLHPVFCYDLADNLGENVQVKFQPSKNGPSLLWAFVPETGDMFAWELPGMKLVQTFSTGESNGFTGFDFSPDGELLFWGNRFFELRRGVRARRIDVPAVSAWCFSKRGDEFFYENTVENKIYALDIKAALPSQSTRKGSKNANMLSVPVESRVIISDVPDSLLSMEYIDGKFWLGFRDRIEVLGKPEPGKPWRNVRSIRFEGVSIPNWVEAKDLRLTIAAEKGFAVLAWNQAFWSIPFEIHSDSSAGAHPFFMESARVLAISPGSAQLAIENTGNFGSNGFWLLSALNGDTLLRQATPSFSDFEAFKGCYSSDGKWVAASTYYGNINLWALQDAPTVWERQLEQGFDEHPMFSPDGGRLFAGYPDSLAVYSTSGSGNTDFYVKNAGGSFFGASDHWVLHSIGADSIEAIDLSGERRLKFRIGDGPGYRLLYAINDNAVALSTSANRVEVRSLSTGELLSSYSFSSGFIGELYFVPELNGLLVVQHLSIGEVEIGQSTVKLWSPFVPNAKPRALRLHDYSVRTMAVESTGTQAAFSNGSDIRIFDLRNIENEIIKIRSSVNEGVQALAFRPNSQLLAAAYTSGKVVFWNTETGQKALQLQVANEQALAQGLQAIAAIGFSHNGNVLQVLLSDGQLMAYVLDPSYIRSVAQDENRQLQSFDVDQILNYNLESALYYPGNFERLAASDDAPLIRSFFMYFRGQAVESNNIRQVQDYCEKALFLYERLDENTKKLWKSNMAYMYEDYAKKLILRGNLTEAEAMINFMQKKFDSKHELLKAHIALLRRNYSEATALYSHFILRESNGLPNQNGAHNEFDYVENEVRQLRDFEFLDSLQLDCFCGMAALSGGFAGLCPSDKVYTDKYISASDKMEWAVFKNTSKSSNYFQQEPKNRLLGETFDIARRFARQYPAQGQDWLEITALQVAENQRNWAVFEQNSRSAFEHYKTAAETLESLGEFRKLPDTSRLSMLASVELFWGKKLLDAGKSGEALTILSKGLEHARLLLEAVNAADTSLLPNYYNYLVAPLFVHSGTALLLEGKSADARQAYEKANSLMTNGLNGLYLANVSVFEQNESEALIDYGSIFEPSQTAIAVFELERLAEKHPDHEAYIRSFIPRMISGLQAKNPRLANEEMGYWLARLKTDYYASQWRYDSTVVWSKNAMSKAKRCLDLSKGDDIWVGRWLDEHINASYFLLMAGWNKPDAIQECLDIEEKAESYLGRGENESFYYANRELLKLNLAHALVLRNRPGDQEKALEMYKQFIETHVDTRGYDNIDLLEKDIHDLIAAGAKWPDMPDFSRLSPRQD